MKLDAKTVAALGLGDKRDVIHFDDTLPGFGYRLRLGAGGKVLRSWIVQYKRGGQSRRLLIGKAEVLGAERARTQAKKLLAKVALGEDPQADKVERRDKDKLNLKSMIDEYLLHKRGAVGARQFTEVQRYLAGPYLKPLHAMPVDAVTRRDIASRLVVVQREHNSSTVASRVRAALSAFYVWAMEEGLAESNPTIGTRKPAEGKPRERVLSDHELAAIWGACNDDAYGKIIRLLILLGSRRGEIGACCWSECDFERATWTLPAARSKNGKAHVLPLMGTAMDIIRSVPRMVSRDQLFGERAAGFTSWARNKPALDRASGVTEPSWTVHDIRRSVATRMADIGITPHIIEEILNHVSGHKAGVSGIYNRSSYDREVKNALAMWERYIALVTKRDLFAAHQAFLDCGDDEQAREKASKTFHDAIAAGGGHWEDYIRALVDGGERKVLSFPPSSTAL
jgi:integrase